MKYLINNIATVAAFVGLSLNAYATDVLNDTFADGSRAEQNLPTESQWFANPGGDLTATVGTMSGVVGTSSANWTTYFSDSFGSSVNLANIGDTLRLTWNFTLGNVGVSNASQNFRLAVVQTPNDGARLTADGTPGLTNYLGYGMFGNMGEAIGRGNGDNLDLMEWASPGGANNILSTSGAYTKIAGDTGSVRGNVGYESGVSYSFVFTIERTASGLQLDQTMTGGNLNGTGGLTNSFLDLTPNTYTFDTFSVRPSNSSGSADLFDTTLVKIEFLSPVPEPSTVALAGLAACGLVAYYRRMRR